MSRNRPAVAACLFAIILIGSSAPAQSTKPAPATKKNVPELLAREADHLRRVRQGLDNHPKLGINAYMRLDVAIADRFLTRIISNVASSDKGEDWRLLQLDQIKFVLDHADQTIADVDAGKLPAEGLGPNPVPTDGPVKIQGGVFVTDCRLRPGDRPKPRPYYFGGYGHFDQVIKDLPNFSSLGVSLIQDGRHGPAQGLAPDYSLTPVGKRIKTDVAEAAKGHVKVDILTSPHYFPQWALAATPEMQNGTPYQNIDHPATKKVLESWLTQLGSLLRDEPALLSYCLSNEPVYGNSGRDKFSVDAWHDFLKRRHGTIETLNAIYETSFKSFADVPASGWPETDVGRRRAFDWSQFNDEHFAAWHKWMGDVLHQCDGRALTHAKIMVFFALDYDKGGWGIDPEQFADATDIAGCDAYAHYGPAGGVGPLDESTSSDYAYHWQVEEMSYDLLNSFRNQPVFNSENHPMPNAAGAYKFPSRHTRAVMWQGGLHHQGATTTWVWEEAKDPSLNDSIYFRPANVWAQARALLDLNRLADEVTAINRAPARVAILYSPASRFWQKDYAVAVRTCYTALTFLGEKVTFVSERQLAERRAPEFDVIVLPHATHVTDKAADALRSFGTRAELVCVGNDCLAFDEYNRPRRRRVNNPAIAADAFTPVPLESERSVWSRLDQSVRGKHESARLVTPADQQRVWGVEYRTVADGNFLLVPVIDQLKEAQTVDVVLDHPEEQALDLLSGQIVRLKNLQLRPMEPLLLKIARR